MTARGEIRPEPDYFSRLKPDEVGQAMHVKKLIADLLQSKVDLVRAHLQTNFYIERHEYLSPNQT